MDWSVGIWCFEDLGELALVVGVFILFFSGKCSNGDLKSVLVDCDEVVFCRKDVFN